MYKKIDFDMFDRDSLRVNRGGSWFNSAVYARAAVRSWRLPGDRGFYLGIRLCRDLSTSQEAETPATGSEHAQES
jgi:formylglycine-generating enzyme required for sulfatase activity